MIRTASFLSVFAWFATAALAAAPATQPDPQVLHAQAIEALRAGKSGVAATLMEKAYAATLAEQRTRPVVLNRAIIDLTQRTYVMRAVRELADYLRAHAEVSDEQAHDILGAALNAAARSPRIKQGEVWQSAYREWARRDEEMNTSRPGYRRFGPYWLDDAQFAELESDRTELQRAIDAQADRVSQAESRVGALVARRDAAWQNELAARQQMADAARELRQVTGEWQDYRRNVAQYERNKVAYDQWVKQQQAAGKPVPPAPATPPPPPSNGGVVVVMPQTPISPTAAGRGNAGGVFGPASGGSESERIARDIHLANGELKAERERLNHLKSQLTSLNRPQWPTTFDPIDPSALTPPPPPPPDPKAVAALLEQAKAAAAAASGTKSPFDQSGTVQRRTGEPALPARGAPGAPTTAPGQVPFGPRRVDR